MNHYLTTSYTFTSTFDHSLVNFFLKLISGGMFIRHQWVEHKDFGNTHTHTHTDIVIELNRLFTTLYFMFSSTFQILFKSFLSSIDTANHCESIVKYVLLMVTLSFKHFISILVKSIHIQKVLLTFYWLNYGQANDAN